jgi:hypothetical protein
MSISCFVPSHITGVLAPISKTSTDARHNYESNQQCIINKQF